MKPIVYLIINGIVLTTLAVIWYNSIQERRLLSPKQLKIEIIRNSQENTILRKEEIQALVKHFYNGVWTNRSVKNLNTKGLERYINKLPVVHHAEVYIDSRSNLHVDVYQRDPVLRVMDQAFNNFYIDSEGRKIPASFKYAARVPVLTGLIPAMKGDSVNIPANVVYQNAFKVAKAVAKDPFMQALIEQIHMNEKGEFILIPKIGNEKIEIGTNTDLEEKFANLKTFYKEGLTIEGWNRYKSINVKFKNQVVCAKNNVEI